MKATSEIHLRHQLTELDRLGGELRKFSEGHQLSPATAQALDLSLAEWVTNIISYGQAGSDAPPIRIRLSLEDDQVCAEISDPGREFNLLRHPPADTSAPLETRPIGGLGIHMIRKLMDRVDYRREAGRNVVTLVKATG